MGVYYGQFMHWSFAKNGYVSGQGISVEVYKLPIELFKPLGFDPVGFNGMQAWVVELYAVFSGQFKQDFVFRSK